MRPIQLYEVVFPEPVKWDVLRTLRPRNTGGYNEKPIINNTMGNMLRRVLKLEAFPTDKEILETGKRIYPMNATDIDITGLGIKKDDYLDGYEQL